MIVVFSSFSSVFLDCIKLKAWNWLRQIFVRNRFHLLIYPFAIFSIFLYDIIVCSLNWRNCVCVRLCNMSFVFMKWRWMLQSMASYVMLALGIDDTQEIVSKYIPGVLWHFPHTTKAFLCKHKTVVLLNE